MRNVKIRLNTQYYQIYIYRQALKAIGDPIFINFGYDPETKRLMIIGTWIDDRKSVRVRCNKEGAVYVFSKALIVGIQKVSNILTTTGSYVVKGAVLEAEKVLIFHLEDAELISEAAIVSREPTVL